MNYRKQIEIGSSGMVVAEVFHIKDGRRVGLKFYSPIFATIENIEAKAIKAHGWADKYIEMCERQEFVQ